MKRTALDFIIQAGPWGITPDAMATVRAVAERIDLQPDAFADRLEALLTKFGAPVQETRYASIRDGVGIVHIEGPLFPKANLMTDFSGATSVERAVQDLYTMDAHPDTVATIMVMHSPGGVAKGIMEASGSIGNLQKKTVSYVSGTCCSAAYPLAAAANGGMVIAPDAILGNLGCVLTLPPKKDDGTVEIVSSQSPDKRPDYRTDDGRAAYQRMVDDLAAVLLDTSARLRNTTPEHLMSARGWVMVGQKAVEFGLADRLGSLEALIAELSQTHKPHRRIFPMTGTTTPLDAARLKAEHPEIYQQVFDAGHSAGYDAGKKAGAEAECQRIRDVEAAALPGHEALIAQLKFDGKTTGGDAALAVVKAEKAAGEKRLGDFRGEAAAVTVPAAPLSAGAHQQDGATANPPPPEPAQEARVPSTAAVYAARREQAAKLANARL